MSGRHVYAEGMEKRSQTGYPSDVSDEEWSFVAPYLTLCKLDAEHRDYSVAHDAQRNWRACRTGLCRSLH